MGDNMSDDMVMDLDLNQEPMDPPERALPPVMGLGPLLSELETAHGRIEDRIRQLEAVTARARQRQRWRQARNNPETSYFSIEPEADVRREIIVEVGGSQERASERGRSCKRDSSHLVAKALEMDLDVKKDDGNGGSFYDCNICLDMAKDPILTCCGHLFCWACFYQVPRVDSSAKECPVCKGEVTDSSVTPIYGNGNDTRVSEVESGLQVPPRPRARRIESVRQQRVSRGISHIPVAEALRRIRIGIGAIGEQPRQQGLDGVSLGSETAPQGLLNAEAGGSRRLRSRQFSRVLSESAASLSSISSALNNAERLVEDLETYIHDRLLRRTDSQFLPVDVVNTFISNADVTQAESPTMDSSAEVNSALPQSSSSRRTVAGTLLVFDNLTTEAAVDVDLTVPRPSSRRRSGVSRTSDVDGGISREPRRRRLR